MQQIRFQSAIDKLDWASGHISQVEHHIEEWIKTRPYQFRSEGRYEPQLYFICLINSIPTSVMLSLGDAIHNIHTALEHCIWESWNHRKLLRAKDISKIKLPFSRAGKSDYNKCIDNLPATIDGDQDLREYLKSLCIYPGGNQQLFALHEIDIVDKHRLISATVSECRVSGLIERQKGSYLNGNTEDTISRLPDMIFRDVHPMKGPFFYRPFERVYSSFDIGSYSQNPLAKKLEFSELHEITPKVLFADPEPCPGQQVVETLRNLVCTALVIIQSFQKLVDKADQ